VAAVFLLSMSISHVFHEFIPSVFLGVSDSENATSALPGHRLLLKKEGVNAAGLAAFGALLGVAVLIILTPLIVPFLKPIFSYTKNYISLILAGIICFHLCKNWSKIWANLIILALSGLFGLAVFSLPVMNEPLLPMFSGMFGISSLIAGGFSRQVIPAQRQELAIRIKKPVKIIRLVIAGIFSSSLMGIFPALGPAQAAMLGLVPFKKLNAKAFMFLLGVISSVSMLFSVLTLYSLQKARNGSIAVLGNIISVDSGNLPLLLAIALIIGSASAASVVWLSKKCSRFVSKINYPLLCTSIAISLSIFVFLMSGPIGFIVMIVGAAIGLVPILLKTSRQLLMACLMVPVIGYYL
jgi:putative membrane protein